MPMYATQPESSHGQVLIAIWVRYVLKLGVSRCTQRQLTVDSRRERALGIEQSTFFFFTVSVCVTHTSTDLGMF